MSEIDELRKELREARNYFYLCMAVIGRRMPDLFDEVQTVAASTSPEMDSSVWPRAAMLAHVRRMATARGLVERIYPNHPGAPQL